MNIISKVSQRTYSFRFLYRTIAIAIVAGISLGVYTMVTAVPKAEALIAEWNAKTTPLPYHKATSTVEVTKEKLEVYYQEELVKLEAKYDEAHKNQARRNAIERAQADLEKEKEAIRETELFQ